MSFANKCGDFFSRLSRDGHAGIGSNVMDWLGGDKGLFALETTVSLAAAMRSLGKLLRYNWAASRDFVTCPPDLFCYEAFTQERGVYIDKHYINCPDHLTKAEIF